MDVNASHLTYSAIMLTAVTSGFLISRKTQSGMALRGIERLGIALGAFCGGMLGAKVPFLFTDWETFASGRVWLESGKTITFGLVGGYFGVELAKWMLDVRAKTGDSFAVPVAVAIGIGRLACFAAGCCYGTVSSVPWAVDFGDGLPRHPTQLYELVFHLSMAAVLAVLFRCGMLRGQLIKLYIIAYFVYRFGSEFIRPEPELALGWTFYQWSSVVFVPVFVVLWVRDRSLPEFRLPIAGRDVRASPRENGAEERRSC